MRFMTTNGAGDKHALAKDGHDHLNHAHVDVGTELMARPEYAPHNCKILNKRNPVEIPPELKKPPHASPIPDLNRL